MKASIVLVSLLVACSLSAPVSQLFEPFGDFLQGNVLNSNHAFYASEDLEMAKIIFKALLEDPTTLDKYFEEFKQIFRKTYSTESEAQNRKQNFKQTLLDVFAHNSDAALGKSSFTQHINQFADMTPVEIITRVAGHFPAHTYEEALNKTKTQFYDVDWRHKLDVTPVENQGSCGACVYFAAAAVTESNWVRLGHPAVALSPQQLNDCAHDPARGNTGCQHGSGTFVPTFDYIRAHGLDSIQNYPYLMRDAPCDKNKEAHPKVRISNWHPVLPHENEEALRKQVDRAPVAVAIHVQDGWTRYKTGVYDEPCGGGRNHAVLVVGYGHDQPSNKDFWIVKNQWGAGFGEHGYIRMRRNHGNMCDIAGDGVWLE